MDRTLYIQEITNNIETLDSKTLKNLLSYIKFIKFQDQIEPTLEIISDKEMLDKVKQGLLEIRKGEVYDWDEIK